MIDRFTELSKKHEKMLVGYLWNNPMVYGAISNNKLSRDSFVHSGMWRLYNVGKMMFAKGINEFDSITVEAYLMGTTRTKREFEKAGGFKTVDSLLERADDKNTSYEYHLDEVLKYASLRKMHDKGLINEDKEKFINKLCNASLQEAEQLITFNIDKSFENVDFGDYEVIDVTPDEMKKAISEAKEGVGMGMKIFHAPLLTRQIKGWARGRMIHLGLKSGEGKSTILRNLFLQSIIDNDEDVLILINEESRRDWILNLSIAISNTRLNKNDDESIYKDNVFSGNIKKEYDETLNEGIEWYKENFKGRIKLVVLKSYRFKDVAKIIRKYSKLGINYVLFDTFKPDSSRRADIQRWEHFSEMSAQLADLIKPENLNIGIVATVQLKIGHNKRYLDHESIGKSKEIVDVADITMLGRLFYKDEYPSGDGNEFGENTSYEDKTINVYKLKHNKRTDEWKTVQVNDISQKKQYIIIYFGKNRAGTVQQQIVFEMDYDRNIVKEIGFCNLKPEI